MAEHDERQRVGARRDAAAAIGDDLLFVERAGRGEFGAQRRCRQKGAVLRIDQRSRRHIDAASSSAFGIIKRSFGCFAERSAWRSRNGAPGMWPFSKASRPDLTV